MQEKVKEKKPILDASSPRGVGGGGGGGGCFFDFDFASFSLFGLMRWRI
jgi:hypothetical protein